MPTLSGAPVQARTKVTRVRQLDGGYEVATDQGPWRCRTLVIASGACNIATVPAVAAGLPPEIASLTPMQYRKPEALPDGGVMVVGASATGVQLAREIRASGRSVMLAAGEHVRVPRVYRGRDIKWWMDAIGAMDVRYDAIDDIDRARRLPSLQLIGTPGRETIDLNSLRKAGVEIVGRLAGMRDGKVQFSASLPNHCALADLKMNRLLASIDAWILASGQQDRFPAPHRFEPTEIDPQTRLGMDLNDGSVRTVIWATGYRPDYSWLDVPVLDRKGRIRHDGGVVAAPGHVRHGPAVHAPAQIILHRRSRRRCRGPRRALESRPASLGRLTEQVQMDTPLSHIPAALRRGDRRRAMCRGCHGHAAGARRDEGSGDRPPGLRLRHDVDSRPDANGVSSARAMGIVAGSDGRGNAGNSMPRRSIMAASRCGWASSRSMASISLLRPGAPCWIPSSSMQPATRAQMFVTACCSPASICIERPGHRCIAEGWQRCVHGRSLRHRDRCGRQAVHRCRARQRAEPTVEGSNASGIVYGYFEDLNER